MTLTRISLNKTKNKDGISYAEQVFEAIGVVPPEAASQMRTFAAGLAKAFA